MVVPGALAGVAIAARALLGTGDRAVTESPTYPNAIATLAHSGARIVGVDVPRDETDTEPLTTTLRQVVPRVAYLIPDFHNPTGSLMLDEGRADVARRAGADPHDRDHRRVDGRAAPRRAADAGAVRGPRSRTR